MNYKVLCSLLLLSLIGIIDLSAQKDVVTSAMLMVSYDNPNDAQPKEQKILMREEAAQFDVVDFLNQNKYSDIQINGGGQVNYEILTWHFDSKKLEQPLECNTFCQVITSVDKSPFLGVGVMAMDDFSGAKITKIIDDSAAEKFGLQIGDVITLIDDYEIFTPCDLTKAVNSHEPGDVVEIDIIRNEKSKINVTTLGYRIHKRISWKPCCSQPVIINNNTITWNSDLSLFPNPTDGIAQVKFVSTQKTDIELTITDLAGRIISTKKINDFDGFYNDIIDLTNQAAGIYFLNVIQGNEVKTEKIVLQKQ